MQIENASLYYIRDYFEYCKLDLLEFLLRLKEEYPIILTIDVLFFISTIQVEIRNKDPS